ncbi:MAG TPA: PAS domain S-box protein [Polyangiaceae bacterium]
MTSSREMQDLHDDLRRSEANFKVLVEGMVDAVFVHQEGVICYANPAMAALLGFDGPRELFGKDPIGTFTHPDDQYATRDFRRRQEAEPLRVLRIRWVRRNGEIVFVEGTSTSITHDGRPAVAVVVRNITSQLREQDERRRVERSLELSEERYRVLFEGSPMSILLFDPSTLRILDANGAAVSLYCYSCDELLGMKLTELKADGNEELRREMAEVNATGPRLWRGIEKHRRKDGTIIDVEIVSHTVIVGGRPAIMMLASDVSDRRRLEQQLRQAQKMEAIGSLAGGVAHDFNNILAVIVADADFLRSELGEGHPLCGDVDDIESAAHRGAALTRQMLTFSRQQPMELRILSLNTHVSDLSKMLARILGEDVRIQTSLDPRLGSIEADPGQVDQVLLNLVINSRDAMPQGGNLVVETANLDLADGEAAMLGLQPGAYVRLTVQDSGMGMTPAVRDRIFEPFFTTKEVGKGTGLGLATVFGIVARSRGMISVDSEPGRGTTFRIHFPRVEASGATAGSDRPSSVRLRGAETILLVEDDAHVRRAVSRLLKSRGYAVLEVDGGASALDVLEREGDAVHLVLTDVVMPDMDGRTLADRMRARRPNIRVVFMSGYTDHPALKGAALAPTESLLQKPFTPDEIASAVRRALSGTDFIRASVAPNHRA